MAFAAVGDTVLGLCFHSLWDLVEAFGHVSLHVLEALLHLVHPLVHVGELVLLGALLIDKCTLILLRTKVGSALSLVLSWRGSSVLFHFLALAVVTLHYFTVSVLAHLLLTGLGRLLVLLTVGTDGRGVRRRGGR